ncbi:T-complex protein 1 subunit eta [Cucumispora dikerogammari]|nr:T-complex protein 1 subunit eta [Cucumispora dikerogammari]
MYAPTQQEVQAGKSNLHSTAQAIQSLEIEDTRDGIPHLLSNIEVWSQIAKKLKSTLGPYGRDKVLVSNNSFLITNDGATIISSLDSKHPATRLLQEISRSQDKEVGDGTTSVVLLSVEILEQLKELIETGYEPSEVSKTLDTILNEILQYVDSLKESVSDDLLDENIEFVAGTALNSKILQNRKHEFAGMLKYLKYMNYEEESNVCIKKVTGGSIEDSILIRGVAFEKTFSFAGHEQLPKTIKNPLVACLDIELEWKSERDNSEARISTIESFKKFVDAEWKLITNRLDTLINKGVNVVLSKKPIGDYATQYFASKNVFCAGRIPTSDLERIATVTKTKVYGSVNFVNPGTCELFEERQCGNLRYNFLQVGNEDKPQALTFLLRGPGEEVLNEVERSLNDALVVVKRLLRQREVIRGGGYLEMKISNFLKQKLKGIDNKENLIYKSVARSFEIIPSVLAKNFGLDNILEIQKMRCLIMRENIKVSMTVNGVCEDSSIREPLLVKQNLIKTAMSAVKTILSIDSSFVIK